MSKPRRQPVSLADSCSRRRTLDPLRNRAWPRFRPPHCPNRHCPFYQPSADWHYIFGGWYRPPAYGGPLPRYRCGCCRRTFTARTFDATYWLHRWDLFVPIVRQSVAGSGLRQIGRTLHVSYGTVARHLARAGRYCLVFHRHLLRDITLREPIAFDGFETFEYSQYFPCHLNIAVGGASWFVYHFTDSPLRRKGRMTQEQKQRRAELERTLGRPDPKAIEKGIVALLSPLIELKREVDAGGALVLLSDDHGAYPRAVRLLQAPDCTLTHRTTPSRQARTADNPLFPVNLSDLLLRHTGANHRRETIAFSKRRQAILERLAIFAVWRNLIKWRREKIPGTTAAMAAGILDRPLHWSEVFWRRLFPRQQELPGPWWDYYWRKVKTVPLGVNQSENRALFAF